MPTSPILAATPTVASSSAAKHEINPAQQANRQQDAIQKDSSLHYKPSRAAVLAERFSDVRQQTLKLASPLSEADMTIQAADFVSPSKWHLAHTTWFFEEFFLNQLGNLNQPGCKQETGKAETGNSEISDVEDVNAHPVWQQSPDYRFLFNSYYETIGKRQPQSKRGLITRPDLAEVLRYRAEVDRAVIAALTTGVGTELEAIIELGLHHEQQHQELFLTDILYNLAQNPMFPAYQSNSLAEVNQTQLKLIPNTKAVSNTNVPDTMLGKMPATINQGMIQVEGGLHVIGHEGDGYGFDNEFPAHTIYLQPFALASHLVTNQDWMDFMADGGYRNPLLWLADGWKTVQTEGWDRPLYWLEEGYKLQDQELKDQELKEKKQYRCMSLAGLLRVNPAAPVCHISFFEADAYARWVGKRLPTEGEWEVAAQLHLRTQKNKQAAQLSLINPSAINPSADTAAGMAGHFAESQRFQPQAAGADDSTRDGALFHQLFGDVWEWTASPYVGYPGFRTSAGAVGEYNGKFMNGQYVLRGGSCVTPTAHIRPTYRNFFYPHQRWQFSGLRLAE